MNKSYAKLYITLRLPKVLANSKEQILNQDIAKGGLKIKFRHKIYGSVQVKPRVVHNK